MNKKKLGLAWLVITALLGIVLLVVQIVNDQPVQGLDDFPAVFLIAIIIILPLIVIPVYAVIWYAQYTKETFEKLIKKSEQTKEMKNGK